MTVNGKTVEIPSWAANTALWVFRGLVALTCATAWSMYLDVRDLTRDEVLRQNDWNYEKRLLLVDHELLKTELAAQEEKLAELEDRLR